MSVPNFGSIEVQMWPPGGVSQKRKSAISEVTMIARVTKLLLYCVSSEVTLLTVYAKIFACKNYRENREIKI